jgi:hypothetical protein
MTRRSLLRWLTAAGAPSRALASRAPAPPTEQTVRYRAKATVLMLSMPVFSRDNVGGGYLRVAEREELADARRIELEFAAGSLPERAAGLDRSGAFEETILEVSGQLAQANYFGFMTVSNEKSLEKARAALQTKAVGFTAIRGRITEGRVWNRLARLSDLPALPWSEHRALAVQVRRKLDDAAVVEHEMAGAGGERLVTFLYAVRAAMRSAGPASEHRFVHNGEALLLRAQKRADPERGAAFVAKGLAQSAQVDQLVGQISHPSGRLLSTFQLWFEPGLPGPLPLRFEFRARSFLRLAFERVVA